MKFFLLLLLFVSVLSRSVSLTHVTAAPAARVHRTHRRVVKVGAIRSELVQHRRDVCVFIWSEMSLICSVFAQLDPNPFNPNLIIEYFSPRKPILLENKVKHWQL